MTPAEKFAAILVTGMTATVDTAGARGRHSSILIEESLADAVSQDQ
jgi:hypothetical protein